MVEEQQNWMVYYFQFIIQNQYKQLNSKDRSLATSSLFVIIIKKKKLPGLHRSC